MKNNSNVSVNNDDKEFQKYFHKLLNERIHKYFQEHNLSPKGNKELYIKAILLLMSYFVPYIVLLFANVSTPVFYGLWVLMGLGMAGVGMGVMHDGNHGSFSKYDFMNRMAGFTMFLLSGNVITWKIQHNILHHTYTNVYGKDEDVDTGGLIRLHPEQKWRPIYRLQPLYAPLLYGLLTLNWLLIKDFVQLYRYHKEGLLKQAGTTYRKELLILIITKLVNYFVFLILPFVLIDRVWYEILTGILVMHFTAGITLSFIFQMAHVMPDVKQIADLSSKEKIWSIHQLATTANFARKNKILTWYLGGLNFQIEHHLFPHISHIHYPEISEIVKQTAEEFNIKYMEYKRFSRALVEHFRYLIYLSKQTS
ncbi:fatty acid desaturase family protein [Schleiferia thermophila]|jgi:linoleoyl-CoA desaturase|uniref:Linoleoyl-CoA desaturase n=1 Tax=Schleiferia thermophila TaxID=884107 RepID=A0A369A773_9FLAO|nr:acyl-CoA desaturase [Schleiferia thermophila]KFD38193.1 fatty acid desaturase [Schleiferia thermophila str. Yellowstone]RCX05129.1 linoleoyl-CoA desaturase [Schleiferia thermophila]GCD79354.1 fatty acid desaturase [Schleiferia thermophila]